MNELTTKFAEYICDKLCKYPEQIKDQEELDLQCNSCKMGNYIIDICNKYDKLNDFEQSKCYKLLEENGRLKEKEENVSRVIKSGTYYCPRCNAIKEQPGYCRSCGQRSY